MKTRGMTFFEVAVTLAVIALIFVIGVPFYQSLQTRNDLDVATEVVKGSLRRAQNLTVTQQAERWGVFFNDGEVVVFRGESFQQREEGYDEKIRISPVVNIEGPEEVIFYFSGAPSFTGDITLSLSEDEKRIITINSLGLVSEVVLSKEEAEEPGGSEDPEDPGEPEGPGDPEDPEDPGQSGEDVFNSDIEITADWGEAYCAVVTITTESEEPVVWEVEVVLDTYPINGEPYNVWNAQWSFEDMVLQASGDGWNNMVSSSTPRNFGFCANRPN